MSKIKFGRTWWGKKWLNALKDIDYSNRLPRGKRYAKNGSVKTIDIKENVIKSIVVGRRKYNVKIKIPLFKDREITKIKNIIKSNSYYQSHLFAKKMPEELYQDLLEDGINLFPEKWDDFYQNCSCPDWAVPCKHLAAVIYLIANEIDKNPFILFNLHGYDILNDFENDKKLKNTKQNLKKEIMDIDEFVKFSKKYKTKSKSLKIENYYEKLNNIDLSDLPSLRKEVFKILKDNPLFFPKYNIKELFKIMYKYGRKEINKSFFEKRTSSKFDISEFEDVKLLQNKKTQNIDWKLINKEKSKLIKNDKYNNLYVDFVLSNKFSDLKDKSKKIQFLWVLFTFIFILIKNGNIIPQIVKNDEKYKILWVPAFFNNKVENKYELLLNLMPENLLKNEDNNKYYSINKSLILIISDIIKTIFKNTSSKSAIRKYVNADESIVNFFFFNKKLNINKFERKQIPNAINLWLNNYYIIHKKFVPAIRLEEVDGSDKYEFEILIKNKEDKYNLINLKNFIESDKYKNSKKDILKDLSIISEHLPIFKKYLKTDLKKPVLIGVDEFIEDWFDALMILDILSIKTIIPKSLKKLIKPKPMLSLKKSNTQKNIKSYLDLKKILRFDWKIAIDEEDISFEKFMEMAEKYSGIVKFKDKFVYINNNIKNKLLKTLKNKPDLDALDIIRLYNEKQYDNKKVLIPENITKMFDDFFSAEKIEEPVNFKGNLRDYQKEGYRWLYHNSKIGLGSIIADDMGLGKTIQVIALLLRLKNDYDKQLNSLVVVPTSLVSNWEKEVNKFTDNLNVYIYYRNNRDVNNDMDITLTTYGTLRNDVEKFQKKKWDVLIIDEAQNIKNYQTATAKAVKSIDTDINIAMTGTPVENSLKEYWSIFDFTNRGLLGEISDFVEDYAVPIEKHRNRKKLNQFLDFTSPFILRREKSDKKVIDSLPEKKERDIYCSLSSKQSALYKNVVERIMKQMDEGENTQGLIFKLITSLKQICNHPDNYLQSGNYEINESGKLKRLIKIIDDIYKEDKKALIFTQYTIMGNILKNILEEKYNDEILYLNGSTPMEKRNEMVNKFQNKKDKRIFLLSLKAGGTGLNLTGAEVVVHYDLWWNPAVESQATDRAYRIGQENDVSVYRFITKNTFEERINNIINEKKDLFDLSVASGGKILSNMSKDELNNFVKLS